jgi:hypothetical protein
LKTSTILEVGGPDQVTYKGLMLEYAAQKGLTRRMWSVPLLTPGLSSLWLGLVTPVFARIGRKLVEGLRNPSIVRRISPIAFQSPPLAYTEAISRIIQGEEATAGAWWYQAQSSVGEMGASPSGSHVFKMKASRRIPTSVNAILKVLRHIGGRRGYFFANWVWGLRGWVDLWMGGVGHARTRGRTDAPLMVGDVVDWWRVVQMIPDRHLTLQAEMKMPGVAILEFDVRAASSNDSTVVLTATYTTDSMWGRLYWWVLFPVHYILFRGLLRGLAQRAISVAPDIQMGSSPPMF